MRCDRSVFKLRDPSLVVLGLPVDTFLPLVFLNFLFREVDFLLHQFLSSFLSGDFHVPLHHAIVTRDIVAVDKIHS